MLTLELKSIASILITVSLFLVIIYLAVFTRLGTINSPTVLDYDPWWFYRYASEILKNNFQAPKWDILSFYPPGRPVTPFQGWPYTMVIFYYIASFFKTVSFTEVAKVAPLIMVALTTIPAFFLGKILTNKWGGLATALFATLTPTFLGVSMAGYCDSDAPVVFYFFLSTLFIMLSIIKKKIYYYILAILSVLLFVFNWGAGWLPLHIFMVFIPAIFVFRIIEDMIHERKIKFDLGKTINEVKPIIIPLLIIFVITNILALALGFGNMINSLIGGLGFTGIVGERMLVNISVAELQVVNILTREGFFAVVGRIGWAPTLLTLFGLPLLVIFKLIKKIKIHFAEIFLFTWALIMFLLILRGVRFSILFSCAAAASAGYVIGNLFVYLKRDLIGTTIFGIIALLILMFLSDALLFAYTSSGMEISKNWYDAMDWLKRNADKDSLLVTWWDPGHILTGYTGLKVHADGAHCSPQDCIPYNHNIRIQDMGRIFSTSSEDEAISILKKYKSLSPEDCEKVKKTFDGIVPKDACNPVTDMYVIASSDLIGKYTWMNYFGGFRATANSPGSCYVESAQTSVWCFWQFGYSGPDNYGNPTYAGGAIVLFPEKGKTFMQCLQEENCSIYPIWGNRFVVKEIVYFTQFGLKHLNFANETQLEFVDGMLWVDPGFGMIIFMPPSVRDSLFTRMFFWNGEGLKHFEFKYGNAELKIFKVIF